jgi:hypothetical protein
VKIGEIFSGRCRRSTAGLPGLAGEELGPRRNSLIHAISMLVISCVIGLPASVLFVWASDAGGVALLAWPDGRNGFCSDAVFSTECDVYAQRILDRLPNLRPYQPPGWSDRLVVSQKTGTSPDDFPLYNTDVLYLDWAAINNGYKAIDKEFYGALPG